MYDIRNTYRILKDLQNTRYFETTGSAYSKLYYIILVLEDIINEVNIYGEKFKMLDGTSQEALEDILDMSVFERQKILQE